LEKKQAANYKRLTEADQLINSNTEVIQKELGTSFQGLNLKQKDHDDRLLLLESSVSQLESKFLRDQNENKLISPVSIKNRLDQVENQLNSA